jgi:N-methylhydantoinase A
MQRHDRRNIYDLFYAKPAPPVRRKDCFEVAERLGADGLIETPLDEAKVRNALIPALKAGGYRAVAICLLNAYANPKHEERLAALITEALPGVLVTCSHQVAREFREFERASTTILSAYVQPVIDGYLHRFENKLAESGFKGRFTVMQSNGGRLPAEAMRTSAITALYSGPAAGVVGATRQAARSGFKDLITFDMGGTSTDVCLVQDGRPSLASESEIDGLPIRTPVLDIVSVGAGGGSIAWVDDGGMLRVGPQSAGADPGPACYGKGGAEPAITDAHIVIGTIRPTAFLGGRMKLDADAAKNAFASTAERFALSTEQAASAALQLADANIVRAIQLVSTERGRDPRDYALVPFGGAGPLHAARIAEELGISTIVVPPNAGVISAYGLVASDYTKFDAVTRKMKLDEAAAKEAARTFAEMRARLATQFADMKLPGELVYTHTLDMRFVGQAFEVGVEIPADRIANLDAQYIAELFADAHHRTFMHGATLDRPVEIVTLRVGATLPIGAAPKLDRETLERAPEQMRLFHGDGWIDCVRHTAEALTQGQKIDGPSVIEGYTATTWVPPGWTATLDASDNLILQKVARRAA